jgi:hypothetical protein
VAPQARRPPCRDHVGRSSPPAPAVVRPRFEPPC